MCTKFTDYVGCTECNLAVLKDGKCICVDNAKYSATNLRCECDTNFIQSEERSVECKSYYKSREVSARFGANNLSIIVYFSRPVITFRTNSCSNFINPNSLAKLGTLPTCSWNNNRTVLAITLGQSATITEEPLHIKELDVVALGSTPTCASGLRF